MFQWNLSETGSHSLRRYLFSLLGGLALAVAVFFYEDFLHSPEHLPLLHRISDAASVSGVFFLCAGMFAFILNGGGFDAFAYIGHRFRWGFSKRMREEEPHLTPYYEFVARRREKGKISVGHLFITGGVFLAVGIVAAMFC